ncbi:hypothetical protein [Micromonospora sp. DT227]|uniref:hypothetical protein n=1 Tax=Micromonospora sp. DT227 TaxID=3393433 RepID=UPI003CF799B9
MAIEWHLRVNRRFTLHEAVDLTRVRLADLLGQPDAPPPVRVVEASAERRRGGPGVPLPADALDRVAEPAGLGADVDFFLEIPEWRAGALLSLSEFLPGVDDPEAGVFVWVTSQHDPASQVLSIAACVAFAECADSEVVDEYGYLAKTRTNSPEALLYQLRVTSPVESFTAAADLVLSRTRLRRR